VPHQPFLLEVLHRTDDLIPMPPSAPARVLVIKHGAFGDLVQSTGALKAIRAAHPGAHIAILTAPAFASLFRSCPFVDEVLTDPRSPIWNLPETLRLRRKLVDGRFDRVYDLQNSDRTAAYFHLILPSVEWSGTARGCALPHREPQPKSTPILPRLAGQLADAGINAEMAYRPELDWLAEPVEDILQAYEVERPYVVLLAGSSGAHPQKRWPHFSALAARLSADGYRPVAVPGPGEHETARELGIASLSRPDDIRSFGELAGILAGAALVIGNDSGPTHLAAHLGTPVIALFGSYYPSRLTGIARDNVEVIEVRDLAGLTADEVALAARRTLSPAEL